jgi:predicted alpha/beta-hydrolase family hydrolase
VILAHGAGQGIDSPFMRFFHEALSQRGLLSVQFNFEYMDKGKENARPAAEDAGAVPAGRQ